MIVENKLFLSFQKNVYANGIIIIEYQTCP